MESNEIRQWVEFFNSEEYTENFTSFEELVKTIENGNNPFKDSIPDSDGVMELDLSNIDNKWDLIYAMNFKNLSTKEVVCLTLKSIMEEKEVIRDISDLKDRFQNNNAYVALNEYISNNSGALDYDSAMKYIFKTITFVHNESVNEIECIRGDMPKVPHINIIDDDQYEYTFEKWSPKVSIATENTTYNAVISKKLKKYRITFVIDKGKVTQEYEYGAMPVAPSSIDGFNEKTHSIKEWSPQINTVSSDCTYVAVIEKNDVEQSQPITDVKTNEKGNVEQSNTYVSNVNRFTRFEKARIIGARALQISHGAPVLVDYPEDMLDPIDIALLEYDKDLIPITVVKD